MLCVSHSVDRKVRCGDRSQFESSNPFGKY